MGGSAMKITAAILLALMTIAGPAQAYTVSAKVGSLIREAMAMFEAKNYKAAMAKVDEAEVVKSIPGDTTVINSMRQAIAAASLDPTQPQCTSAGMGVT